MTYRSLVELQDKTQYYLHHHEERAGLIARARERIVANHTHGHRLQALEAFLKPRFGSVH